MITSFTLAQLNEYAINNINKRITVEAYLTLHKHSIVFLTDRGIKFPDINSIQVTISEKILARMLEYFYYKIYSDGTEFSEDFDPKNLLSQYALSEHIHQIPVTITGTLQKSTNRDFAYQLSEVSYLCTKIHYSLGSEISFPYDFYLLELDIKRRTTEKNKSNLKSVKYQVVRKRIFHLIDKDAIPEDVAELGTFSLKQCNQLLTIKGQLKTIMDLHLKKGLLALKLPESVGLPNSSPWVWLIPKSYHRALQSILGLVGGFSINITVIGELSCISNGQSAPLAVDPRTILQLDRVQMLTTNEEILIEEIISN